MANRGRPPCPKWLKLHKIINPERDYEIQANRAAAVLWMFQESAKGMGDESISRLMPSRFPPWPSALKTVKKWDEQSVSEVLKDPSVMGEIPRYEKINGKRAQVGVQKVPPIIEPKLFNQVQRAREARQHRGRRMGTVGINVFGDKPKCECCERTMRLRGDLLICTNVQCPAHDVGWPYRAFDESFHSAVTEIDRLGLVRDRRSDDEKAIELEIEVLRKQRADKDKEIGLLQKQIDDFDQKIHSLQAEIENLKSSSKKAEQQRRHIPCGDHDSGHHNVGAEHRIALRNAILIADVIHDIQIAPDGTRPRLAERITLAKTRLKIDPPEMEEAFISGINWLRHRPFFRVRFNDGRILMLVPNRRNARLFDAWDEAKGPEPSSEEDTVTSSKIPKGSLPEAKVITVLKHDAIPQTFTITAYGSGEIPAGAV